MPFGICLPFWFCNQSGNEPPFGPETGILPCAIASKDQTNASQTSSPHLFCDDGFGDGQQEQLAAVNWERGANASHRKNHEPIHLCVRGCISMQSKRDGSTLLPVPYTFHVLSAHFQPWVLQTLCGPETWDFLSSKCCHQSMIFQCWVQRCGRKSGISASCFTLSPPAFFLQTFVCSMKGSGMVKFLKNFLTKSLWALPWALSGCSPDAPSWAKAVTSALWQPVSLLACAISCTSTALKEPKDHFLSKRRHSGDSGSSSLLGFSSGLFLLLFILSLQQAAAHVGGKAVPWSCWTIRLPSPFYSFLLEPKKKKTRAFQPWQLKQWAFQPWKFTVVELQVSCDCINQGLSNPENSL